MEVSAYLHRAADLSIPRKQQAIVKSFARALEIIPRQLCDNAGFDATNILTRLRVEHRKSGNQNQHPGQSGVVDGGTPNGDDKEANSGIWMGVDFDHEGVRDNMAAFVWEPSAVKINAIQAATEACCLVLSVDETISKLSFILILLFCFSYLASLSGLSCLFSSR